MRQPVDRGTGALEVQLSKASAALAALLLGAFLTLGPVAALGQDDEWYQVQDGKVDQPTFNGYRRYHASCHTCHGPDGLGSSYAPSLVESLKTLSYEEFSEVVVNGRQNVSGSQQSVMPAFGYVDDVMLYINDIYGYLKARSDGVLGRGRPERFDR